MCYAFPFMHVYAHSSQILNPFLPIMICALQAEQCVHRRTIASPYRLNPWVCQPPERDPHDDAIHAIQHLFVSRSRNIARETRACATGNTHLGWKFTESPIERSYLLLARIEPFSTQHRRQVD